MSSSFFEFTRLSCSKDNTTVMFNDNNCAAIFLFLVRNTSDGEGSLGMDGTCVKWNTFFTDKHFPPKFPEFSGIFW